MKPTEREIKKLREKAKDYDDFKSELLGLYAKDYEDETDFIFELQDLVEAHFRVGSCAGL